jgi:hypothetical protein
MYFKANRKIVISVFFPNADCLDLVEKAKEVLMPVPPVARADRHSGNSIHGRKQRRDSVALVVMRLPGGIESSVWNVKDPRIARLDVY